MSASEEILSKDGIMRLARKLSNATLDELKENTPKSQFCLGTVLGLLISYPSVKIGRALALFSGGLIIARALSNKCECYIDLSTYKHPDLTSIVEYIKHNGALSVGFTAGYLIGFAYA